MRRAAIAAVVLLTACTTGSAVPPPTPAPPPAAAVAPPQPANEELAKELQAMAAVDQEVRNRWIKDQMNETIRREMSDLSERQVARLREIVSLHGWPGASMVGKKGSGDAWLIAQHGGSEFLQAMLPLMYEAVKKRELDETLYATSLDRVLTQQGKPQMYGTQFDVDPATGKCEPKPIADPERVDERRRRAGMTTLAEYTAQLCAMYLQR